MFQGVKSPLPGGCDWWRLRGILLALPVIVGFLPLAFDSVIGGEPAAPALPDFGLILTDDGGFSFTDKDPRRSEENLRAMIQSLKGTPVKTLVYEVAAGSQVMFYPTKVGSVWGWRAVAGEKEEAWIKRMPIHRAAAANGLDAVRTAGKEAKDMGLYFMPGYRMNDGHFAKNPAENVLTGEFWMNNRERCTLGVSPIAGHDEYAALFDFSHQAVREHSLAVIREVIDRYCDIMDGIQLDFMRHPLFFPPGTAQDRAHLMTELLTSVRAGLDDAGKREGRFLVLSVRAPATLATCRGAGLEVERWIADGLVNLIIPSPSITLSHDMPVDEWVTLARVRGVKIHPGILPRTQFHWPFVEAPTAASYGIAANENVGGPLVRGTVRNFLAMGASGFEMYNYNLPAKAEFARATLEALADPWRGDRVYAITPSYWREREPIFEYPRALPAVLPEASPVDLPIFLGEELPKADRQKELPVALRLGFRGLKPSKAGIVIKINDRKIYEGPVAGIATPTCGRGSQPSRLQPPVADCYLQIPIADSGLFRMGRNKLTLILQGPDSGHSVQVVEAGVAVFDRTGTLGGN